jgi:hypothetical protein
VKCELIKLLINLIFIVFLCDGVPQFHWDEENLSRSGIPLLKINFPEYGDDDLVHLSVTSLLDSTSFDRSNEATCIFEGFLEKEPDMPVAVTGCPGSSRVEVILIFIKLYKNSFYTNIFEQSEF